MHKGQVNMCEMTRPGRACAGPDSKTATDEVEEASLLLDGHWIDERLVPISEVAREPSRRRRDLAGRPCPVWDINGSEGSTRVPAGKMVSITHGMEGALQPTCTLWMDP